MLYCQKRIGNNSGYQDITKTCDEVKQIYANLKNIKLLLGIKFGSLGQEEKIKGR